MLTCYLLFDIVNSVASKKVM